MSPAQFITVEGLDGCGKTTQLEFIARWLGDRGVPTIRTREPGGTALGEELRRIILHHNYAADGLAETNLPPTAAAELLIIFAARAQHLAEVVRPALAAGKWVVCDRFSDSTYAYQGGGRKIDAARIALLEKKFAAAPTPNLTIWLDATVETCAARVAGRDFFERQGREFQQHVLRVYQQRAQQFPQRIKPVDANQSAAAVRKNIAAVLDKFWTQTSA